MTGYFDLIDKQVVNIIEVCHLLTGDVQVDAGDGGGRMVEEDGEFDQGSLAEFVSPPQFPSDGFPPTQLELKESENRYLRKEITT